MWSGQLSSGQFPTLLQVLGQIDGRHAAFAQMAFDLVATGEGSRELGRDLGHGDKMQRGGSGGQLHPRLAL